LLEQAVEGAFLVPHRELKTSWLYTYVVIQTHPRLHVLSAFIHNVTWSH